MVAASLAAAQNFFGNEPVALADVPICKLSQKPVANIQPDNGLNLCNQYGTASCCTALHDRYMFNLIHTDSQKTTPDYLNYWCFGCSPTQPQYTNESAKTITICKSTAEKIWSGGKNGGN